MIKSGGGRFFFGSLLVCKKIFFSGCSFTEYLLLSFHCFFFSKLNFLLLFLDAGVEEFSCKDRRRCCKACCQGQLEARDTVDYQLVQDFFHQRYSQPCELTIMRVNRQISLWKEAQALRDELVSLQTSLTAEQAKGRLGMVFSRCLQKWARADLEGI